MTKNEIDLSEIKSISKNWKAPEELADASTPRQTYYSKNYYLAMLAFSFLLLVTVILSATQLMNGHNPHDATPLIISPFYIILIMFFAIILPARKQKKILETGLPLAAVVTKSYFGRGVYHINYYFHDFNGSPNSGKSTIDRSIKIKPGVVVTILYLEKYPKKTIAYPPPLVRLEIKRETKIKWMKNGP